MKKYKLIAALVASMSLTTGCYELDIYPEGELSTENFFKTKDHADQAMMGIYSLMTNEHVFGRQYGFDCLGTIGCGYDAPSYKSIAMGNYTTTDGTVSGKFKALYEGVARANILLQNVDKCNMTDEEKKQYKAEAKFMRALYYFTLIDFWGGVPLYDETTIVEDNYMTMLEGKSDIETVREFILADLKEATENLPVKRPDTELGRATSGAALALKGKVLLYAKRYDEAKACFEEVVGITPDSKYKDVYELYRGNGENSYANLFTPVADNCSEMIFTIQNMGGVGTSYGMPMAIYMGNRATFGSGWNNVMAATDFVDSYEWKDGTPFKWDEAHTIGNYTWSGYPDYNKTATDEDGKTYYPERERVFYSTLKEDAKSVDKWSPEIANLEAMYEHRDPRMKASIILPYTDYKGWYANAPKDTKFVVTASMGKLNESNGFIRLNDNSFKYPWRKFVPEYDMDGAITDRFDTPINFPLIRLADVYLMLAECYVNCSEQDLSSAKYYVNEVRRRVGMPGITASDADGIMECIRHEREVELAAEGHSFSDMKRWGLLETLDKKKIENVVGNVEYTRTVIDRDYLWPFPQSECDMNPDLKAGQNPGW